MNKNLQHFENDIAATISESADPLFKNVLRASYKAFLEEFKLIGKNDAENLALNYLINIVIFRGIASSMDPSIAETKERFMIGLLQSRIFPELRAKDSSEVISSFEVLRNAFIKINR